MAAKRAGRWGMLSASALLLMAAGPPRRTRSPSPRLHLQRHTLCQPLGFPTSSGTVLLLSWGLYFTMVFLP